MADRNVSRTAALALLVLALAGCAKTPDNKQPEMPKPHEMNCSKEQMVRVEHETKFCAETTSYFSSYCYQSAMFRLCERRK